MSEPPILTPRGRVQGSRGRRAHCDTTVARSRHVVIYIYIFSSIFLHTAKFLGYIFCSHIYRRYLRMTSAPYVCDEPAKRWTKSGTTSERKYLNVALSRYWTMGFDAILSHRLDYKTALILTRRKTVKHMGNCERISTVKATSGNARHPARARTLLNSMNYTGRQRLMISQTSKYLSIITCHTSTGKMTQVGQQLWTLNKM